MRGSALSLAARRFLEGFASDEEAAGGGLDSTASRPRALAAVERGTN
ncbi:hypothetical protein PR002_g3268 [Phytophthora rubi]|uniref:Uncharacterized protein n=1 Tax=Phytophthora rubi TaxID=129364 RepID=A0A6A3NMI7_9STRA|nr:hypothetical protein PR002_g3268 [Phytophthora rubi]